MSHGRSTPPTPAGSQQFASSHTQTHQFAKTPAGIVRDDVQLTIVERFAVGGSDSAFRALAGAAGGFTSGVITCPLDVIKTKLQAQGGFRPQQPKIPSANNVVYQGLLGTARVIWREEGLKGMYRGLGPIILGYLPTWAVWFTVYGKSKEYFVQYNGMLSDARFPKRIAPADRCFRQRECSQFLVINCGWGFLYDGHESNMGDQDSPYVASKSEGGKQ